MAFLQNGYLRASASEHFNFYQTSARELHHFLYPLHRTQQHFWQWIHRSFEFYGFEEGYDFVIPNQTVGSYCNESENKSEDESEEGKGDGDILLSLDTAKELARITRTERGREARYYFVEFESQFKELCGRAPLDKKIKQLNTLANSMKVGKSVVYLARVDLINLLQAVQQYEDIVDCYIPSEYGSDLIWIRELIERIKRYIGKQGFSQSLSADE